MSKATANWEKKLKIRHGEPIECLGLTFYPITVARYEEFLAVKDAWTIRLSSLPLQYAIKPFLSALVALDLDSFEKTGSVVGFFARVLRLLYLSLRLEYKAEDAFRTIYYQRDNPKELSFIKVTQNGNTVKITPQDFAAYIRPLVAEQNGLELPDESFNPEIVEAEQQMANEANKKNPLIFDSDTLIASVAYLSHLTEKELDEWTILQFEHRIKAIERDKRYMLYGQAELSGMVKFPKGNPYSSWCYDGKSLTAALVELGDLQKKHSGLGDIVGTVNAGLAQANKQNSNKENT